MTSRQTVLCLNFLHEPPSLGDLSSAGFSGCVLFQSADVHYLLGRYKVQEFEIHICWGRSGDQ